MTELPRFTLRSLRGVGFVGVLFVGVLGLSAPVDAQKDGDKKDVRIIQIDGGKTGGEKKREFRIVTRDGKDGETVIINDNDGRRTAFLAKCDAANKAESNIEAGRGDRKYFTRILICGDKGETSAEVRAELLKALQTARAEYEERGTEPRQEVIEALDREIARVRAETD